MENQKKEKQKTLEFLYQETQIHFLVNPNDKNVMINATEMSKTFGKRTKDYLANSSTKKLIEAIERTLKSVHSETERTDMSAHSNFKILENRGHMGIYFCEDLALDFAMWLDVDFKLWVYKTIKNVLTKDTKFVKNTISEIKTAEQNLSEIITKAKSDGNKDALTVINALEKIEKAKKNKSKAMRLFTNQMKMNL